MNQPMLQTREEPFNSYPYIAQRHDSLWDLGFPGGTLSSMLEWCRSNLQSGAWGYSSGNFFFREDKDRMLFLLRWS